MSLCVYSEFMIIFTVPLLRLSFSLLVIFLSPCWVKIPTPDSAESIGQRDTELSELFAQTKQPAQRGERSTYGGEFMQWSCVYLAGGKRGVISSSGDLFRPEIYKNPEIRIFSLFLKNTWLFALRWACKKLPGKEDLGTVHWVQKVCCLLVVCNLLFFIC